MKFGDYWLGRGAQSIPQYATAEGAVMPMGRPAAGGGYTIAFSPPLRGDSSNGPERGLYHNRLRDTCLGVRFLGG